MINTKERPKPRGVCSPTILQVKSLEGKPGDVNLCYRVCLHNPLHPQNKHTQKKTNKQMCL